MPKFYWISYISPYIAGIITYIILKVLQKKEKLKKFDRFVWSPFVVAFAGVCLFLIMICFFYYHKYVQVFVSVDSWDRSIIIVFIMIFSQFLWIAFIFQFLAIIYRSSAFLMVAQFFSWAGILSPLFFFSALSGFLNFINFQKNLP